MISTAPVSKLHLHEIAAKLRRYDRFNITSVESPDMVMRIAVEKSLYSESIFFNGKLGVVWGLQAKSLLDEHAEIWMLTTQVIENNKIAFIRRSRRITDRALMIHPVIRCSVDMSFIQSKEWLLWLGFKTVGSFSIEDVGYYEMELRR